MQLASQNIKWHSDLIKQVALSNMAFYKWQTSDKDPIIVVWFHYTMLVI